MLISGVFFVVTFTGQTFYKELGSASLNEGGTTIIQSQDGNYFVGGNKGDSALVMKIDPFGNIIWSRCMKIASPTGNNYVFGLSVTPDNYLIGVANVWNVSSLQPTGFYFKYDLNGNLQWLHSETYSGYCYFRKIEYSSSGEYLVLGNFYQVGGTWNDDVMLRVNAVNGAIISNSPAMDYIGTNSYNDDGIAMTRGQNGMFYSTGRVYVNGSSPGGMRAILTKMDQTGNHIFTNYLQFTSAQSARIYGTDIVYDDDSLLISYFGDIYSSTSNFSVGLIKTDTLGNVVWAKDYNISSGSTELAHKLLKTNYGYALLGHVKYSNNTTDIFIIAVDHSGTLLWSKSFGAAGFNEDYDLPHLPMMATNDINDPDKIYFTAQSNVSGTKNIIIAKVDANGNISCVNSNNLTVTTSSTPTNTTSCPVSLIAVTVTSSVNSQSSSGMPTDACNSYNNPDLGNDTSFCGVFSMPLDASVSGATQYEWSTGATTASISASAPGTYTVAVYFNCCVRTDTIVISGGAIYVTNSYSICDGDSVQVGGNYYSDAGTYMDTLASGNCDTIVTTSITISPSPTTPNISANGNVLASDNAVTYQWYYNGSPIPGATSQFYTATQGGFYQVQVTNANGCTAMSQPFNFVTEGIHQSMSVGMINVFPNPSNGNYCLQLNTKEKTVTLKIFDTYGRELQNEEIHVINEKFIKEISLANYANGIYYLYLFTEKSNGSVKLLKQ